MLHFGCRTGKRRYSDKQEAKYQSKMMRKHRGDRLQPYKCPHCGWWHIGHKRKYRNR